MATRPTKRPSRSELGSVRRLPSGRYQASYRANGERFTGPRTFHTKDEGLGWLAEERADRLRGTWRDPRQGDINLADYLSDWLASRQIADRTRVSYTQVLERWVLPRLAGSNRTSVELGLLDLGQLTPTVIRRWYSLMTENARIVALERLTFIPNGHPARLWARATGREIADTGVIPPAILRAWKRAGQPLPAPQVRPSADGIEPGRATAVRAYQVLHAAMADAANDGLIQANPCRIAGAATHRPHERGTVTPAEVVLLAENMPERLRAAVYVAAWSGLRYGELFALARRHVDLSSGAVTVERALTANGNPNGLTKTKGSVRRVTLPDFVVDELRAHINSFTRDSPDALVFSTESGGPIVSRALSLTFKRAREAIGRPELHWHDLRHTGATLAYMAGATMKDVQRRLGHSTTRAAMIYAHAADDSDRTIADRLNAEFGASARNVALLRRQS